MRRTSLILFTAAALAVPRPAAALFGGGGGVVFDPKAAARNVAKVAQLVEQARAMEARLEQLDRVLADANGLLERPGDEVLDQAAATLQSAAAEDNSLAAWRDVLPLSIPAGSITVDDLPRRASSVREHLRERVATTEAALASLEDKRRQVTRELAKVVAASGDAEGPKAAQQATNQLQALLIAERARLTTLSALRDRLAADARLADEAHDAASAALRNESNQENP